MKIIADYHTHTFYSDGKTSIEENVNAARKIGLKELAITDHGYKHFFFGIKRYQYKEMRQEVDRLNEKYDDITVKLGIEANILGVSGRIDIDDEFMSMCDILLAGYHFGSVPEKFFSDLRIHFYNVLSKKIKYFYKKAKKLNTQSIINALRRYDIEILTHPGDKGPIDLLAVAKVANEEGTVLEISAHHKQLTVDDIKATKGLKGLKYVISSDAHHYSHIGQVDNAIQKAIDAKLDMSRIINIE